MIISVESFSSFFTKIIIETHTAEEHISNQPRVELKIEGPVKVQRAGAQMSLDTAQEVVDSMQRAINMLKAKGPLVSG